MQSPLSAGWDTCSLLHGTSCHGVPDDRQSDCSTDVDNQESDCRDRNDSLEESYSDSGLEVETLVIFDWDDTLFPTSWMQQNGLLSDGATLSSEQKAQLELMASRVESTLQAAALIAKVVVVTNAARGWIELTSTNFMPSLSSLLQRFSTVSARSLYEHSAQEPSEWKRMAFDNEVQEFYGAGDAGRQRNIVSVGDSLHELHALKSVTKDVQNCCGKSIKLLDTPSIEQLIDQHEVIIAYLLDVVEHNGDLDVEIGACDSE